MAKSRKTNNQINFSNAQVCFYIKFSIFSKSLKNKKKHIEKYLIK